jgi:hypothetical protein
MSNYTPDEVTASVSKIVLSSVSHPTGILGNRGISKTFDELQEAAAGVYILYFNAPFYTIKLGSTQVADLVDSQALTIISLIEAIQACGKLVTPIKDISPLANANAALQALGGAISNRSQGFQDITQVPAFQSYAGSVNQFIQEVGGNVKTVSTDPSSGVTTSSVTDTPQGARSQIPSLVTQMQNQHQELIRRATLLAGAMQDFGAMNLPQSVAQGVISRASGVLQGHYNAMAAQDENSRLGNLRAVVLDLLTQQPIVQQYGAALAPSEYIATTGFAQAFSDANHLATPAVVLSSIPGPYPITQNNHLLSLGMDGAAPFDYPLPLGHVAELTGQLAEPFVITADNNKLRIEFGNPDSTLTTFDVTISTPNIYTAVDMAAIISAVITGSDLACELAFSPLKFDSIMTVDTLGGNNAQFAVLAGNLIGLGVAIGDQVDVLSGPDIGTTWTIYGIDPAGLTVDATGPHPVTPVLLPGDIDVKIGPAARVLNLRDTNAAVSLASRRRIRFPITNGPADLGAATLGWFPGSESRSRPVAAKDLAANISSSVATASASAVFVPAYYAGHAHSDLTDGSKVVLSILQAEGSITGGTNVTFTPTDSTVDLSVVAMGNRLVLRSTLATAELNFEGVVSSVTAANVGVTFSSPITGGSVGIEVGPDTSFAFGAVLNITTGSNQGRYVVRENKGVGTTCSFELLLESGLPAPKNGALAASFDVEFGIDYLQFESLLKQTTSRLRINNGSTGNGAEYFFLSTLLPVIRSGTTPYLRFATFPAAAEVGDLVLFYDTDFTQPSREYQIVGVDQPVRTLQLSSDVAITTNVNFTINSPVPFGRIRVAKVADFATLQKRLDDWVTADTQQTQFFRNLASTLNPVLLNTNPTASDVNNAVNQLKQLLASLTIAGAQANPPATSEITLQYALTQYSAPAESSVDALLASFRHKGSDRAIDLLLEGQFSTFFGLDITGTSYSAALMRAAGDLAMNDLPIRKANRGGKASQTLIGNVPNQTDFEFNSDDRDSPNTPDIPVGADVPSPGANY